VLEAIGSQQISRPRRYRHRRLATAVMAMLRAGTGRSIRAAIDAVARRECERRPLLRCLLPGAVATNENLLLTTETLIEDAFWREALEHERTMQRGPPKHPVGSQA